MPDPGEQRVILSHQPSGAAIYTVDASNLHRPARWVGWALTLVTASSFAVLWWRPQLGTAQWEFTTVGQTLDRMPLLTIGLLLVALGTVQSRSVRGTRLVAVLFGLGALAIVAMTVLFTLSSLVALGVIPPEQMSVLKRIIARTIATSGVYTVLYAALALSMWRRARGRVIARRHHHEAPMEGPRGVARNAMREEPVPSFEENSRP
jgi:hypothetical protein